jgi:MYXO-CTERM domain-containing protein
VDQFCRDTVSPPVCTDYCGDGLCGEAPGAADDDEDCSTCGMDCGCEDDEFCDDAVPPAVCTDYCGDGLCGTAPGAADDDEDCSTCEPDCGCAVDETCNPVTGGCVPDATPADDAGVGDGGVDDGEGDEGCGCAVGREPTGSAALLLGLLGLAFVVRRRRS